MSANPLEKSQTGNTPTLKYAIAAGLSKFPKEVVTLKRAEICKALNIHDTTLSQITQIKKGEARMVSFDWAMEICRILGIKPEKFINT